MITLHPKVAGAESVSNENFKKRRTLRKGRSREPLQLLEASKFRLVKFGPSDSQPTPNGPSPHGATTQRVRKLLSNAVTEAEEKKRREPPIPGGGKWRGRTRCRSSSVASSEAARTSGTLEAGAGVGKGRGGTGTPS